MSGRPTHRGKCGLLDSPLNKMGTYGISNEEIIEAVEEALNNLEGDFTDKQLKECLEVMKAYPYVADKEKSEKLYMEIKEANK